MTTRETLKAFLNKIGTDADKISYKVNPSSKDPSDTESLLARGSSDLGIDPNTNIDLLNFETKKSLLNEYVSEITSINEYSIKGGVVEASTGKRGESLSNDDQTFSKFVEDSVLNEKLSSYSNSKYFNNLKDIVDKTSKDFNNHNILKDIPGNDLNTYGETLIKNNSDNILLNSIDSAINQANNFNPSNDGKAFAPKGTSEFNLDAGVRSGGNLIQNEYGKFNKNGLNYTMKDLKKIGASILYKASGYDKGSIPGKSLDPEEINDDIENLQNVPEYLTNGKLNKVSFNNMRALNAANAPKLNDRPYDEDPDIISMKEGNNTNSFGATYNSSVYFDGKNKNLLMVKTAIACKAVVRIAIDFYDLVKSSISTTPNTNTNYATGVDTKTTKGPFFLGKSRGVLNSNLDLIRNSLVTKTKFSYTDCIDAGIKVFFGDISEQKILNSIPYLESPGYLLSICLSSIKSYEESLKKINEKENLSSINIANSIIDLLNILKENKLIKFLNVIAAIGDRALNASDGKKDITENNNTKRYRNVDNLSDLPGNRPGKFRKKNGRTMQESAWNQNELASSYILPLNVVRASAKLSQGNNHPNPVKAMLGSSLYKNTYLSVNNDGAGSRIPQEVVKEIEDRLDAEYVPFYIQDLRTNEIISFHAFLDSVSDNITPNFTSTPGYGRMDPVQIYSDTKRNVTVSFTLIATNKEDFDAMWYKINKLTTLVYPQWSQGTKVSNGGDNVFIQPFSQVIGASPLVRLRVGDVIKSNYSRFNLSRIFGIGDPNIKTKPKESSLLSLSNADKVFSGERDTDIADFFEAAQEASIKALTLLFGSPAQYLNIGGLKEKASFKGLDLRGASSAAQEVLVSLLTNGFVNPLLESAILNLYQSPNVGIANLNKIKLAGAGNAMDIVSAAIDDPRINNILNLEGNITLQSLEIKPNTITGYTTLESDGSQRKIYLTKNTKVNFLEIDSDENNSQIIHKVVITDPTSEYKGTELYVQFSDIYFTPEFLFRASGIGTLFYLTEGVQSFADEAVAVNIAQENLASSGVSPKVADLAKEFYKKDEVLFMEPENNPYVRAYETTKGRGLAGTLGALNFSWGNGDIFKWETDYNSRAPTGCKIQFSLAVIHDIPPGMDHSGYNRAPIYNVGSIMKNIAGDPYEDGGAMSKFRYNTGREDKKSGE
jgi:hypothetical protein